MDAGVYHGAPIEQDLAKEEPHGKGTLSNDG